MGEVLRSTIVQLRTPDELRGRVTALNTVFATGGPQLGQLTSGALGSAIGAADAAVTLGGCVLLTVAAYGFNRHLRNRDLPPDVRQLVVEPQPS